MSNKATMSALDTLHDEVAKGLTKAVKEGDVRAMTAAINFLKGNNVTADFEDSGETKSLFKTVQEMVDEKSDIQTVDDMMKQTLKV